MFLRLLFISFIVINTSKAQSTQIKAYKTKSSGNSSKVITGAEQTNEYLNYLKDKKVGMVVNQTSVMGINNVVTVDSLLKLGINVKRIFGPEHGFRGTASNGTEVANTIDTKSGLPVISLYGSKHFRPTTNDLKDIDLMIFDIQDVGTRFYTYLSTLQYVMEACAENNIELMIFDRPNPKGDYVDGPVLDTAYRSFVGMNSVPIVYGLTIAEYALMLNGEGWLKNHIQCKLKIIKLGNYNHKTEYKLPVNPSPNLNTEKSILLYPSVCLFEGTNLSLGRGTPFPFLQIGHPLFEGIYKFSFTPVPIPGMSEDPPQKGKLCFGINLKDYNTSGLKQINLSWLLDLYKNYPDKNHFFNSYFTKLAGTEMLQKQIEQGMTEKSIRESWAPLLNRYKLIRKKYLIYP